MAEILWIEDQLEEGLEEIKEYVMKKHSDYHFIVAKDDREGTDWLKKKRFNLVICDIRMKPAGGESIVSTDTPPRKVGLKLLEALREGKIGGETPSNVSVIALTAIIDEDDKNAIMGVKPPPVTYLEKPVDMFEFNEVVEKCLSLTIQKE